MLTGLKVSSLTCTCILQTRTKYKWVTPWNWILKVLKCRNEIYIPTDRTRRVDEKNGVICLVIMFTHRVMVITMSKMALFLFSDDGNKNVVTVSVECLSEPESFYWVLSENWSYCSRDIEGRNINPFMPGGNKKVAHT